MEQGQSRKTVSIVGPPLYTRDKGTFKTLDWNGRVVYKMANTVPSVCKFMASDYL